MKREKIFGILFIIFSLTTLSLNLKITRAVVGTEKIGINIISLIFLIIGLAFFMYESGIERNLAREVLEQGRFISDPRKIKQIAHKMGYTNGKEVKEGYEILKTNGKPLTVIPRHNISKGVYYNIMESLSSGESNFRNYRRAS